MNRIEITILKPQAALEAFAAERLGLAPSTLRWKMKKLGIERPIET